MRLIVILLNWRNETQTVKAVRALRSWSSLRPRLVVVDNHSTQCSRAALAEVLKPTELSASEVNLGFGGGNNLAIARGLSEGAEYVLLLNTDADVKEAGIVNMLRRLETNRDVSVIGPVLQEGCGSGTRWHGGGRDVARHVRTRIVLPSVERSGSRGSPLSDVEYVPGTVFLARSSIFKEIGLLDEDYFFSGEIADFCKRVRDAGHRVCVDLDEQAGHGLDRAAEPLRKTLYVYYSLRNRFLYVRKHHRGTRVLYFPFWIGVAVSMFGRALIKGQPATARAISLALLDGLSNRYGNQNAKFL